MAEINLDLSPMFVLMVVGFAAVVWYLMRLKETQQEQGKQIQLNRSDGQISKVEFDSKLEMHKMSTTQQLQNLATAQADVNRDFSQQLRSGLDSADLKLNKMAEIHQNDSQLFKQEVKHGLLQLGDSIKASNDRQMDYNKHVSDRIVGLETGMRDQASQFRLGLESMGNRLTKAIDDQGTHNRAFEQKMLTGFERVDNRFTSAAENQMKYNQLISDRITGNENSIQSFTNQLKSGLDLANERISSTKREQDIFSRGIEGRFSSEFGTLHKRISDATATQMDYNKALSDRLSQNDRSLNSLRSDRKNDMLGSILNFATPLVGDLMKGSTLDSIGSAGHSSAGALGGGTKEKPVPSNPIKLPETPTSSASKKDK